VRFFSASGIQRYLWRIEDVVSMVAGREGVIVVHRDGGVSLDGTSLFALLFALFSSFNSILACVRIQVREGRET